MRRKLLVSGAKLKKINKIYAIYVVKSTLEIANLETLYNRIRDKSPSHHTIVRNQSYRVWKEYNDSFLFLVLFLFYPLQCH